jgi:hypothetical protein
MVQPLLVRSHAGTPTAEALSVVSPDGQRTMRPYLGAAKELDVDDLPLQAIAGAYLRLSCLSRLSLRRCRLGLLYCRTVPGCPLGRARRGLQTCKNTKVRCHLSAGLKRAHSHPHTHADD